MDISIREAVEEDKNKYIEFVIELSKFNRNKHNEECKYDDYSTVLEVIENRADKNFENRDENTLILIALLNGSAVGYALAKIYEEEKVYDNGTGKIGLFDEMYLDNSARGLGIGKMLLDEVIVWCENRDIKRIKLHAYSWNEKAKGLYEKNGFVPYAVSYEKLI